MEKMLVSYEELETLGIGYSRTHLKRLEDETKFPKRFTLGTGRIRWSLKEVMAWIESKRSTDPVPPR